jgi:hypothetical protein
MINVLSPKIPAAYTSLHKRLKITFNDLEAREIIKIVSTTGEREADPCMILIRRS